MAVLSAVLLSAMFVLSFIFVLMQLAAVLGC